MSLEDLTPDQLRQLTEIRQRRRELAREVAHESSEVLTIGHAGAIRRSEKRHRFMLLAGGIVGVSGLVLLQSAVPIDVDLLRMHGGWPGAFQTAAEGAAAPAPTPFRPRIVEPKPEERYVTSVPFVPLKAAAGAFSDPQHVEDDSFEWVAIESRHRLHPGMFVAQVVGKSMEPAIPDGAYCLFAAPVEGTRQGRTVLVQLRDATDPETGERYTVKRYESEKAHGGDSWRHATITLKPINPDFEPIVLTGADEGQLQVVAELIDVLAGES